MGMQKCHKYREVKRPLWLKLVNSDALSTASVRLHASVFMHTLTSKMKYFVIDRVGRLALFSRKYILAVVVAPGRAGHHSSNGTSHSVVSPWSSMVRVAWKTWIQLLVFLLTNVDFSFC
jgi:hypothetical protein